MDDMDSGNDSDSEPMSAEVLEYIPDSSKSHRNVNRTEACYKINDIIKVVKTE